MKPNYQLFYLLLVVIIIFFVIRLRPKTINKPVSPSLISPTLPVRSPQGVGWPVSEFKTRITKKFFGTFVTPQNSPVSPERFRGYHTGIDVEFGDIGDTPVPVSAIADGQIIYSGYVNGYGGFVAQKIIINNAPYIVIYGHLDPSSLVTVNTDVKQGQSIGILGKGYSSQTDGERKHLHLAFLKGDKLDFRGYVQNQSELSLWSDPLTFFP